MQKRNDMENDALTRSYATLAALLLEDRVHFNPSLGFGEICRLAGADPRKMERLLTAELGLDGEGLLAALRTSDYTGLARNCKPLPKK